MLRISFSQFRMRQELPRTSKFRSAVANISFPPAQRESRLRPLIRFLDRGEVHFAAAAAKASIAIILLTKRMVDYEPSGRNGRLGAIHNRKTDS